MTREQEIKKRLKDASKWPWKNTTTKTIFGIQCVVRSSEESQWMTILVRKEENANFISHAPEDIAYLLAALKASREREKETRRALRERVIRKIPKGPHMCALCAKNSTMGKPETYFIWQPGEPEKHQPGCDAAPEGE